jgi:hypothetical protein
MIAAASSALDFVVSRPRVFRAFVVLGALALGGEAFVVGGQIYAMRQEASASAELDAAFEQFFNTIRSPEQVAWLKAHSRD